MTPKKRAFLEFNVALSAMLLIFCSMQAAYALDFGDSAIAFWIPALFGLINAHSIISIQTKLKQHDDTTGK